MVSNQNKGMVFKSIIPADRIRLDGITSRSSAIIHWSIEDVFEYERRRPIVHLVEYKKNVRADVMALEQKGDGVVPLRIEIDTEEKRVVIIF